VRLAASSGGGGEGAAGPLAQLTWRSVLTGGVIGMLMAVGNVYMVMKVGLSFGVAITACVVSFVAWNLLRKLSGGRAGEMSILESNCMQSTASAAGYSTGATLSATFAALLMLDPLHRHQPWWVVGAFTFTTAALGVFLAIPMKQLFINREQLAFPSGIAAASTLRSLHARSAEALRAARAMIASMALGALVAVLDTAEDQFEALGRFFVWMRVHLVDVHLPAQVPAQGFALLDGKPLVGFGFAPGVLLIGTGMLVGVRVALSMLGASVLLYFGLAPWLHGIDAAHTGQAGYVPSIPLAGGGTIFHPVRWSLWGGASILAVSSVTALALRWRTVAAALFPGREDRGSPASAQGEGSGMIKGTSGSEVPRSWLIAGVLPLAAGLLALQVFVFGVAWWAGLIAIGMCFILALVVARATGESDLSPMGAMGKVMQLLFAVIAPPGAVGAQASTMQNVLSAGISVNSSGAAADLLTDLKSGYLLGANPRKQFLAQFAGVFFGTLVCVPAWYLLVPDAAALDKYPVPAAQIWVATARALTGGLGLLPSSVLYAVIGGAALGIVLPVVEAILPKARPWLPSATGLGLAWVLPFNIVLSIAIGGVFGWLWRRLAPQGYERYAIPVASGLIAGESIVSALLGMLAGALGMAA
jgi:putative OPT family oligopeptide transporter